MADSREQSENDNLDDYRSRSRESRKHKHLIFSLADNAYGLPLLAVKEVIALTEITPVPNTPAFFKGIINLRGKIISIIDMRSKLGLPGYKMVDLKTSVIITEISGFTVGAIVDEVSDVIGFTEEEIESDIDISNEINQDLITGVGKSRDKHLVILLDIGKILNAHELGILKRRMVA